MIATLPQLKVLDSQQVSRTERLKARQEQSFLYQRIVQQLHAKNKEVLNIETTDTGEKLYPHTPEARLEMARELAEQRKAKDPGERFKAAPPKPLTKPVFHPDSGKIMQRNEGNYEFKFEESKTHIDLRVEVSKFLDTNLIDVDVHSEWVSVMIKGKALHLCLPEPVDEKSCEASRSQATGQLLIRMRRLHEAKDSKLIKAINQSTSFTGYVVGTKKPKPDEPLEQGPTSNTEIMICKEFSKTSLLENDFSDDDEVPPLI